MSTVLVRIPWNNHDWTQAEARIRYSWSGAQWRRDPRLFLTDWTFDTESSSGSDHLAPMIVCRDLHRLPERADVTFESRPDTDRTRWVVVGGFRSATPLTGSDAQAAWARMRRDGWIDTRVEQLRRVLARQGAASVEEVVNTLIAGPSLIWRVRPDDVERLPMIPPHAAGSSEYVTTARLEKFWVMDGPAPWRSDLDSPVAADDDGVTWEGIRQLRLHEEYERTRVRSRIERIKQERLAASGRLACQHCGYDFAKTFGEEAATCVEGHHTRPLASLPESGASVSDDEIVLLCPNCHRAAHQLRAYTLEELRRISTV